MRTLKLINPTLCDPFSLEAVLDLQQKLYPHDLEKAMLDAIATESEDAAAVTKSFLQHYYQLRYSQEMPVEDLAELTVYMIRFVRKTPNDRLVKFLAYTLDSKTKEINGRTL